MQPHLLIISPRFDIELRVPAPRDFVSDADPRTYVIAFVQAERAQALHESLHSGSERQVSWINDGNFDVHGYEVALVERSPDGFVVHNNADVIPALIDAGVDPIPMLVHLPYAAALHGFS